MRNKAVAEEDHRNEPKPRPALNIDIVRCCVTFKDVDSLKKNILLDSSKAASEDVTTSAKGVLVNTKNIDQALNKASTAIDLELSELKGNSMQNIAVNFYTMSSKQIRLSVCNGMKLNLPFQY